MYKHLELIPTKGMDKSTWLKNRRIGGSDVGVIFGLNEYKSAMKLFYEMVAPDEYPAFEEDNIATYSGRVMEDVIERSWWRYWDPEVSTPEAMLENISAGKAVRKSRKFNHIIINPDYPWLSGNIDRLILKNKWRRVHGVLEIKHQLQFANRKWIDEVNPNYALQIQCYLLLTGLKYGEVAVLEDGRFLEVYPFEANQEVAEAIVETTLEFHEKVQLGREIWSSDLSREQKLQEISHLEPEAEGSDAAQQFLKERYTEQYQQNRMLGDEEMLGHALNYIQCRDQIKLLTESKNKSGNVMKQALIHNSANAIEFPNFGQVNWKMTKSGNPTLNVQAKILTKYNEYIGN